MHNNSNYSRKCKTILPILFSILFLIGCHGGNNPEPTPEPPAPHQHTFSEEWSSDETYHWHEATCEHTDVVDGKEEHNYLPFGLCECGRYIGTTLESLGTVDLSDLEYGENAYYKIELKKGRYNFEVDYSLVTTFVYFQNSTESVASPTKTNPTTLTELELAEDKTVYITVVNNNGSVVSGAKFTISNNHKYNACGVCEYCGEYRGLTSGYWGCLEMTESKYYFMTSPNKNYPYGKDQISNLFIGIKMYMNEKAPYDIIEVLLSSIEVYDKNFNQITTSFYERKYKQLGELEDTVDYWARFESFEITEDMLINNYNYNYYVVVNVPDKYIGSKVGFSMSFEQINPDL